MKTQYWKRMRFFFVELEIFEKKNIQWWFCHLRSVHVHLRRGAQECDRRDETVETRFGFAIIYIYKTERCVCLFVCLFVSILLPNYWTDPDQTWHGPPPGPWECPPHTFLGVPPPGGV